MILRCLLPRWVALLVTLSRLHLLTTGNVGQWHQEVGSSQTWTWSPWVWRGCPVPIIYFSCSSPPPASHVWGPGLIVSRQWRRSSFASSRRAREWPWQVVSMGEKCHEGSCCHHPLLPPTRETPSPFLNPLAPLVRIVREIAGRLHEEVQVNHWIGKYSDRKPESMAWKLKEIVVVKTIFVVMFLKCEGSMVTNSKDTPIILIFSACECWCCNFSSA